MNKDVIRELADLYEEYERLRPPAYRDVALGLRDTVIDLFEEDAYLAGIALTFLGKRRLGHGRVTVDAILINRTIDERLEHARSASLHDQEILDQFKRFRESMLKLARALERATGVPIQFKKAA